MRRLLAWVEGQPAHRVLAACILAILLIGIADILTGPQYFLTIVYMIPISLAAWRTDWQRVGLVALLAIAALLFVDALNPLASLSTWAMLWNQLARFAVAVFIVILITGLREARQHAEVMARTDVLTGIANLFSFREASARELERARRSGEPLTLLFLDIDDFKVVNDYHGHSTGDEVLRRIARALCYAARSHDFVARVGGDEFVVLMPRTDAGQAAAVIDRVTSRLAAISRPDGSSLTCSIGAATYDPAPATIDEILQAADQEMYLAKASRARSHERQAARGARPIRLLAPSDDGAAESSAIGMDY